MNDQFCAGPLEPIRLAALPISMLFVMRPMQNVIVGSILLLCSLPVIGGGMRIASDFSSKSEIPAVLDMTQEDSWTTQVKRIDPGRQAFERLPPDISNTPEMLAADHDQRREPPKTEPARTLGNTTEFELAERQADEWCSSRFRSYVKADKSYQPFGGGPRRRCIAPIEVAEKGSGRSRGFSRCGSRCLVRKPISVLSGRGQFLSAVFRPKT